MKSDAWLVTITYIEGMDSSLYIVRASSDVEAIRNTLSSSSWAPVGTIKSIEPKQITMAHIDDSMFD